MRYIFPAFVAALSIPAMASASAYSASPSAAPSGKLITRDILWSCAGGSCSGASDYSRPLIVCQSLAKKAGRLDSFRVDGRAIAPAEHERCNASAKPAATTASGNQ